MLLGARQYGESERMAVERVLKGQILYRYHGSCVAEFESSFSEWIGGGVKAVAVNSGTSALHVAFGALQLTDEDEVLVPMWGFISAVTAIMAAGGVPKLVPVDRSLCIDLEAARRMITPKTRAILAVHPYGEPCDLGELGRLAEERGLNIVEDVAQCCGGSFRGRRLGTFGTVAAFSFQHFKLLSTGEGGMVVSAGQAIIDQARFLHDAAAIWTMPDVAERVKSVTIPPLNLRMSELEGAIGLAQLARCDASLRSLRRTHCLLANHLIGFDGIELRPTSDGNGGIGSTIVFYVDEPTRAKWVAKALRAEGVNASTLLGSPGSNRHWAVDWISALEKCGAPLPDVSETERVSKDLSSGVVVSVDIRYSEQDVQETLTALQKVLSAETR